MQTRLLKHTDLTVSRACFGTMTFGAQVKEPDALRMIERCREAGVNFFDTAPVYNQGASEEILGRALAGRRQEVVLATKVRPPLTRAAILASRDESLRRLQTSFIDVYYLHQPDHQTPLEETLATMDELVRSGKVRYPASSNYAAWQVVRMLHQAQHPAWITQPMYNLIARGIEQEYLPMCRAFGVATIVYNPLAGGLLTGKQPVEAPLAGTRFDANPMYLNRYWHAENFAALAGLRAAAESAGRSLVSLALNWLLHHTPIDGLILGASSLAQLEENLAALEEGPLPAEALEACEQAWARLRGVVPKYNR